MKHLQTTLLCLGFSLVGHAESPRVGLDLGLRFGSADSRDINSNTGITTGLFLEFPLDAHQSLRPRFDYAFHPSQTRQQTYAGWELQTYTTRTSTKVTSFGVDYLYHLNQPGKGLFLMGGVNYSRVSVHQDQDATYRSIPPSHDSLDITAPYKLGCALGIGYAFDSHWSTELRFTSRKGSGDLEEAALDAYGLSVSYRF